MVSFCMSTARALVKPTASTFNAGSNRAISSVRASAVTAVNSGIHVTLPAFGRNVAARRGLVSIAAAPLVSSSKFHFEQRAAFSVSVRAADGDEAAVADSGEGAAAAGPVKLYVGNLSWGVDDVALEEVFGSYGASDMTVVSDMNTGRSRGFGFVSVPSQEVADKVIAELNNTVSHHRHNCPHPPPIF